MKLVEQDLKKNGRLSEEEEEEDDDESYDEAHTFLPCYSLSLKEKDPQLGGYIDVTRVGGQRRKSADTPPSELDGEKEVGLLAARTMNYDSLLVPEGEESSRRPSDPHGYLTIIRDDSDRQPEAITTSKPPPPIPTHRKRSVPVILCMLVAPTQDIDPMKSCYFTPHKQDTRPVQYVLLYGTSYNLDTMFHTSTMYKYSFDPETRTPTLQLSQCNNYILKDVIPQKSGHHVIVPVLYR